MTRRFGGEKDDDDDDEMTRRFGGEKRERRVRARVPRIWAASTELHTRARREPAWSRAILDCIRSDTRPRRGARRWRSLRGSEHGSDDEYLGEAASTCGATKPSIKGEIYTVYIHTRRDHDLTVATINRSAEEEPRVCVCPRQCFEIIEKACCILLCDDCCLKVTLVTVVTLRIVLVLKLHCATRLSWCMSMMANPQDRSDKIEANTAGRIKYHDPRTRTGACKLHA